MLNIPPKNTANYTVNDAFYYLKPDLTFSVSMARDIEIWKKTSENLLSFVPSSNYAVIVPDSDLILFKSVSDKKFEVIPESVYLGNLSQILNENLPLSSKSRIGWYLQQFIKLAVLKEARNSENFLIWDSDTIPLKEINFFRSSGEVEFYSSTEEHHPYFKFTQKLLGLDKIAPFSFIAQCFPCKGYWSNDFFKFIEEKFENNYINSIIRLINFEEQSGFSEYETLGTFFYSRFLDNIIVKSNKWIRNGTGLIGSPYYINKQPYNQLLNEYEHITFESWEVPFSLLERQSEEFLNHFLKIESSTKSDLSDFLDNIFNSNKVRTLIQIGANDGLQNDPLRKYILSPGSFITTLVEPIPYYVNKLNDLYFNRNDVRVLQAAIGSTESTRELFFIPPEIAEEMDGDGPPNGWAHGQGSFEKETVINWIIKNQFRGDHYVSKMDEYINAITSIQIQTIKTESILPINRNGMLLVIDVQGFEFEVLKGINWKNPPQWIMVEDDLGKSSELIRYFMKNGFQWVAGKHDKLFEKI